MPMVKKISSHVINAIIVLCLGNVKHHLPIANGNVHIKQHQFVSVTDTKFFCPFQPLADRLAKHGMHTTLFVSQALELWNLINRGCLALDLHQRFLKYSAIVCVIPLCNKMQELAFKPGHGIYGVQHDAMKVFVFSLLEIYKQRRDELKLAGYAKIISQKLFSHKNRCTAMSSDFSIFKMVDGKQKL